MSGFHNPYMQTPDFGQGFSDLKNKILMVLLATMGMPMPGMGKSTETSVETPTPAPSLQSPQPKLPTPQDVLGAAPPSFPPMDGPPPSPAQAQGPGSPFGTQMPPVDPQMLMMLMQMMQGR